MEKLQEYPDPETEKYIERALSGIYFLQKCLDFEKGGELAVRLLKYMNTAQASYTIHGCNSRLR